MNVGDSALMAFRPSARKLSRHSRAVLWPRLLLRSVEATHYFNCPYQVSASTLVEECSTNADELAVAVRPGDVLLAVTDGVTDNLFDAHIQEMLAAHLREILDADPAACAAGLEAFSGSLARTANAIGSRQDDPSTRTPFGESARGEGYVMEGGKLDDVAVVCAVVRDASHARRRTGDASLERRALRRPARRRDGETGLPRATRGALGPGRAGVDPRSCARTAGWQSKARGAVGGRVRDSERAVRARACEPCGARVRISDTLSQQGPARPRVCAALLKDFPPQPRGVEFG
eukprot:3094705-Prymnesium_polylepis.1